MKKIITPLSPSASLLSLLWRMSPTFWSNPAGWCSSTSSPWTCSSQRFPQVWAELSTCRPAVNNILLYFQWKMSDQWISAPDPASPSRTRTRTVWQVRSCWQANHLTSSLISLWPGSGSSGSSGVRERSKDKPPKLPPRDSIYGPHGPHNIPKVSLSSSIATLLAAAPLLDVQALRWLASDLWGTEIRVVGGESIYKLSPLTDGRVASRSGTRL